MTLDSLALAMEKGFKRADKKLNDVVKIMLNSFQSNQDYMDKKFDSIDNKFDSIDKKFRTVDRSFTEVKKKIDNVSLNIVDIVRQEEFGKLEQRVTDVEEVLDLKTR